MSTHSFPTHLPRHSFTPREIARASDLWRVCQDVAVEGSSRSGWTPQRYIEAGSAYVMRLMTVEHPREIPPTATLWAKTWVSENRRDLVSVREIRLYDNEAMVDPVTRATQEWAHIDRSEGLKRAPPELVSAFPLVVLDGPITLPKPVEERTGKEHVFTFRCWHIWRDALGHLNHPDYVDAMDEGIYEQAARAGLKTEKLAAYGEKILYRASINAGDEVRVATKLVGVLDAERCVFKQRLTVGERLCAETTCIRGYPEALLLERAFL